MMDLAIVVFSLRMLVMAGRLRWRVGSISALLTLLVWLALTAAGWLGHGAERWEASGVWMLFLLGPSGVAAPTEVTPLANVIGEHAVLLRAVMGVLAWLGFALGSRRADRLSPLSDEARRWNDVALSFLPLALLVGVELLLFAAGSLLSDGV